MENWKCFDFVETQIFRHGFSNICFETFETKNRNISKQHWTCFRKSFEESIFENLKDRKCFWKMQKVQFFIQNHDFCYV